MVNECRASTREGYRVDGYAMSHERRALAWKMSSEGPKS